MDMLLSLLAVAAAGVTYDWAPIKGDPDAGCEYIVQVEPALVEAARKGQLKTVESNVPANAPPIRRVRVVLGGDKTATEIAAAHGGDERYRVARPTGQATTDEAPTKHTVRQGIGASQRPFNTQTNQLQQGFEQATQQFESAAGSMQRGLQDGMQQGSDAMRTAQQTLGAPGAPGAQGRTSIGSEFRDGVSTLRDRTRDVLEDGAAAVDGTVRNLQDGLRSAIGAPAPAPPGSNQYVPGSYMDGVQQPISTAPLSNPGTIYPPEPTDLQQSNGQPLSPPPPWQQSTQPTGAQQQSNQAQQPTWQDRPQQPNNPPQQPTYPPQDDRDAWVNSTPQPAWDTNPPANTNPPSRGGPLYANDNPYEPIVGNDSRDLVPVQPVPGGGQQEQPQQSDWNWPTNPGASTPPVETSAGGPVIPGVNDSPTWGTPPQAGPAQPPFQTPNQAPPWSNNPPQTPGLQTQPPTSFAGGTGGALPPPAQNPYSQPGYYGQQQEPEPSGLDPSKPWGTLILVGLACIGSLGGNLFLGWSYLDARNKYQNAPRRTVRTFTRGE